LTLQVEPAAHCGLQTPPPHSMLHVPPLGHCGLQMLPAQLTEHVVPAAHVLDPPLLEAADPEVVP
jgi:hypothetical protein